ncbi:MAG: hypothetical protein ABIS35_06580 [Terracoccus sp.]
MRRPARSRRNHRRRWLSLLLALPFMLGIGHRGVDLVVNGTDHGFGVSAGVLDVDDNPGSGTVVTPVTDDPAIAAPLPGRPGVEPWSTAESRLRIEVVSALTGTANVAVSGTFAAGSWGPRDFDGIPLPVAYEVVLGRGTTGLEVTASARTPEAMIQCRVYAGADLVAVATGRGEAVCTIGE